MTRWSAKRIGTLSLAIGALLVGLSQTASGIEDGGGPAKAPLAQSLRYSDWFTDEALRVDLYHSGTGKESGYGLDEIVVEEKWPGTRRYLNDPFGYGSYPQRCITQSQADR